MKRLLALIAVVLLLVLIFPYSAMAASVDDIIADWTPSTSGVGANTKAFDFPSLAAAQEAAAQLQDIGYTETAEGLAETTVLAENTYAFFDLASFGWGTSCTLYVYVPGAGGTVAAPPAAVEPAPVEVAPAPAAPAVPIDGNVQEKVEAIVSTWTPSASGVGGDTKAFEFASMADAQAATSQLIALGYNETSEGLAEQTILAPFTFAYFDLAAFGWGTTVTVYVYVGNAAPPEPLNFTFSLKDKPDLKITINDAYEKYGYFFLQPADNGQKEYLFRVKENGSVSFSQDVILKKINIQTGEAEGDIKVNANTAVSISEIHDTRLYLSDSATPNYVQFLNDKSMSFYIPPQFITDMANADASRASFRNRADNELHDGTLSPYAIFAGNDGWSLMMIVIVGVAFAIPMLCVVLYAQNKELKSGGVKFTEAKFEVD